MTKIDHESQIQTHKIEESFEPHNEVMPGEEMAVRNISNAHSIENRGRGTGFKVGTAAAIAAAVASATAVFTLRGGGERENIFGNEAALEAEDSSTETPQGRILIPIDRAGLGSNDEEGRKPQNSTYENSEQEPTSKWQPVLMVSQRPTEIIKQYEHNLNCSLNGPVLEDQLECVRYQTGSIANGGELTNKKLDLVYEIVNYRASNPGFQMPVEMKLVASKFEGADRSTFIAVVEETDVGLGETYTRRMRFKQVDAAEVGLSSDGQSQPVWLIRSLVTLEPGDTSLE